MKSQKTNNKLAFQKAAVTELNVNSLEQIKGGTGSGFTVGTTSVVTILILKENTIIK